MGATTSRPAYVPHTGQTRCGRRGLWHCGHALKVGAAILCCARRLLVRLCDCFCLGTAMGREGYRSAAADLRPMTGADVPAADAIARRALTIVSGVPEAQPAAEAQLRLRRIVATDPAGCWVAEHDGRVAGVALSIVREGIWGLSLFAVEPADQGLGLGRRLIDAALAHADGTRGGLIVSSSSPSAMRRYARAGFELRPSVWAEGTADRAALGPPAPEIAEARAVRGAGHGEDLRCYLEVGERLLTSR